MARDGWTASTNISLLMLGWIGLHQSSVEIMKRGALYAKKAGSGLLPVFCFLALVHRTVTAFL